MSGSYYSANHYGVFISESDHSVEIESGSNHSCVFMSGSDHSVETMSTSNHSGVLMSGSDHSVETKSTSDHSGVFMPGSDHSVETKSGSNHSGVFMSGSDHSVETKSSSNHSGALMSGSDHSVETSLSGSDHSVETKSTSDHSGVFMSGSDHSVETKSSSNHSGALMSGSDHSVETKPTSEHSGVFMSRSDHSVETKSSSEHSGVFMSGSDHSVETKSTSEHSGIFMSGSDHSVETKSTSDHSGVFMSGSDHLVETKSSREHSGVFTSGSDHSVETKSSSNHSGALMSGSGHSVETKPTSEHSGVFMSRSDHSVETKSSSEHSGVFMSGSDHSVETKSTSEHSGIFMSGSDHSIETKSNSNHYGVFMSGSDHSVETKSSSEHSGVFMSRSDHSVETKSSSNHSGVFMSESNHSVETKSTSEHSDIFMSGSDHSVETKSTSDHSGVFMSESNHSVETKSTSEHSDIFMSGSDHSVETKSSSNHSSVFMSGSDHADDFKSESSHSADMAVNIHSDKCSFESKYSVILKPISNADFKFESNHHSTDFNSGGDYSSPSKPGSDHMYDFHSRQEQPLEIKSTINNSTDFKSASTHNADVKSESDHSDDFKSSSNHSTEFELNNTYSYSRKSNRVRVQVTSPIFFDVVDEDNNAIISDARYSGREQFVPPVLPTSRMVNENVYISSEKANHSNHRLSPKRFSSQRDERKCNTYTEFQPLIRSEKAVIEMTSLKPTSRKDMLEDILSREMYRDITVKSSDRKLFNEGLQSDECPCCQSCGEESTMVPVNSSRFQGKSKSDNKLLSGQFNLNLNQTVPLVITDQDTGTTNQATRYIKAFLHRGTHCAQQGLSEREMDILSPLAEDASHYVAPTTSMVVSVILPQDRQQCMGHSLKGDVGDSSSIFFNSHNANPELASHSEQDLDQERNTTDHSTSVQQQQQEEKLRQEQVTSEVNAFIKSDMQLDSEVSDSNSDIFCTPGNSLSRDSLSLCKTTDDDEMNDFDSIVPRDVEGILSLSELCACSEETHMVTFSNYKGRGKIHIPEKLIVNRAIEDDTVDMEECVSKYDGSSLTTCSADDLHQTCSSYSLSSFLSIDHITTHATCQASDDMTNCKTNQDIANRTVNDVPKNLDSDTPEDATDICTDDATADATHKCTGDTIYSASDACQLYSVVKHHDVNQTAGDLVDPLSSASTKTDETPIKTGMKSLDHGGNLQSSSHSLTDEGFISHSSFFSSGTEVSFDQQSQELIFDFSSFSQKHEQQTHSPLSNESKICAPHSRLNGAEMIYEQTRYLNSMLDIPQIFPQISNSSGFNSSLRPPVIKCTNVNKTAHELSKTAMQFAVDELLIEIMEDSRNDGGTQSQSLLAPDLARAEVHTILEENNRDVSIPRATNKSTWIKNVIGIFEPQSAFEFSDIKSTTRDKDTDKRIVESTEKESIHDVDFDFDSKGTHTDVSQCEGSYQGLTQCSIPEKTDASGSINYDSPQKNNQVEEGDQKLCIPDTTDTSLTDNNLQSRHRLIPAVGHQLVTAEASYQEVLESMASGSKQTIVPLRSVKSLKATGLPKEVSLTDKSKYRVQGSHRTPIKGQNEKYEHAEDSKPDFPRQYGRIIAFCAPENVELYEIKSKSSFSTYERLMPQAGDLGMIYKEGNCKSHTEKTKSKCSFWKRKRERKLDKANIPGRGQICPSSRSPKTSSVQYGIYIWSPSNCSSDTPSKAEGREIITTEEPKRFCSNSGTKERTMNNTNSERPNTPKEKPRGEKKSGKSSRKSSLFKKTLNTHTITPCRSIADVKQDGVFPGSQENTPSNCKYQSLPGSSDYTSMMISKARKRLDRENIDVYNTGIYKNNKVNDSDVPTQDKDTLLSQIIADYTKDIITSAVSGITEKTKMGVAKEESVQKGSHEGNHLMKNISGVCKMDMIGCKQDRNDNVTHLAQHTDEEMEFVLSDLSSCIVSNEEMVCRTASALTVASLLSKESEAFAEIALDKANTDLEIDIFPVQSLIFHNTPEMQSSSSKSHVIQEASTIAQKVIHNAYEQLQGELFSKELNQKFAEQTEKVHKLHIHEHATSSTQKIMNESKFQGIVMEAESRETESSLSVSSPDEDTDFSLSSLLQQSSGSHDCDFHKCSRHETEFNKSYKCRHKLSDRRSQGSNHRSSPITNLSQTFIDHDLYSKCSSYIADRPISAEDIARSDGTGNGHLSSSIHNFKSPVNPLAEETYGSENDRHTRKQNEEISNKQCVSTIDKENASSKNPLCPFQLVPESESERYRLLIEPQEYPPSGPDIQIYQNLSDTCIQATSKLEDEQWYFNKSHASSAQYACQYYSRRIQCSLCKKD